MTLKGRSILLKSEDYWAIWLGGILLLLAMGVYYVQPFQEKSDRLHKLNAQIKELDSSIPFRTVEWFELQSEKTSTISSVSNLGKSCKSYLSKPKSWTTSPVDAFYLSEEVAKKKNEPLHQKIVPLQTKVNKLKEVALQAQMRASKQRYKDVEFNEKAHVAVMAWQTENKRLKTYEGKLKTPFNLLPTLVGLLLFLIVLFGLGKYFLGANVSHFAKGFSVLFVLGIIAFTLSSHTLMKSWGISYAIWGISIGLFLSNTFTLPEWLRPAISTEYYIKTGLILLGSEILLSKIMAIGLPGIFVAWVVTPTVLILTYLFGQKVLKIKSKSMNMVISADMSVCGVSAAIATASACKAKKEELTLAVGMSMIFTSIMMIVLPAVIKAFGMSEVLGGAWIGGTLDATGAVVAAGAFLGDTALSVAATIKMIQNVLIGFVAFAVAVYWSTKVEPKEGSAVGISEIWKRFPKFIIGFLAVSVLFSILYKFTEPDVAKSLIEQGVIRSFGKNLRGWFFCLAFVSIGLSTDFRQIGHYLKDGKAVKLYLAGQTLNLILTILMAYLMFEVVFPEVTATL